MGSMYFLQSLKIQTYQVIRALDFNQVIHGLVPIQVIHALDPYTFKYLQFHTTE